MTNASVLSKKKHLDKGAHPYFSTTASLKEGNNSTKTVSNLQLSRFSQSLNFLVLKHNLTFLLFLKWQTTLYCPLEGVRCSKLGQTGPRNC